MRRSPALSLISIAVLVAACSSLPVETPVETVPDMDHTSPTSDDDSEPTTVPSEADCIRFTGDHSTAVNTGAVATDALHLSGEVFLCADDVVVVGTGDLNEVAAASQLAAAVSGPLLFPEPRLAAELGRLNPARVHIVGELEVTTPADARTLNHTLASAAEFAQETLGVTEEVRLPATPDVSTVVETVLAIDRRDRVVFPQTNPADTPPVAEPVLDERSIVAGLAVPSDADSVWMVDASAPETILLASAVGRTLGVSVIAFDGGDLLANPEVGRALGGRPGSALRFVGEVSEASTWELNALIRGDELPGGGFYILPDNPNRRYFAYYGHPETGGMGALGQQDGPAETLARMRPQLEAYGADGAQVIPTFEIISSVASAGPGEDGNYSFKWPVSTFRPWVDFGIENGVYVLLDLQPGRSDFLTQAMFYEELLLEPNVGLALDPEWRLKPDQVHLEQIGTVDAAEVNQVIEWLADLVRDNGLPQKMLLLQQFRLDMITNRDDLADRPEIQLVIQMDGEGQEGGEAAKDATWNRITAGTEDMHWRWGWKNFFERDFPAPPPPENVLGKEPTPVFVSYQ